MKEKFVSMAMLTLLLVSAINFAAISFVAWADGPEGGSVDWWLMFRHDENHTGYSASNVSTPIVSYKNLTTSGKVRSSPAVVNDVVFVGALDGYVYRWDVATWTKKNSTKFGPIFSSPAVVDGVVYIGSNDSYVYALNAVDLAMIRNFTTGGAVRSSPVVVEGIVYAGSFDGYFYAWNISTGSELWKFWTASPIESSPAVSGDTIVFGTNDGRIYALERISGRIRWYHETNGAVISSPAVEGDIVFVGSNDTNVYALDATTGTPKWNYSTGGNVTSSPAVAHGMVFVGSDNGYVYALDITTGWSIKNYTTGGPVSSSPTVTADGMVFVGSDDKKIYAFNASTGEQIWNNGTEGPVYSSPAIAKGMVFVGSDDHKVYVFVGNRPPVANFTHYPEKPIVTQQVTFDGSQSSEPDNATGDYIEKYEWDFGDDTPKDYGITVNHTYYMARTYNVTLTVTDKRRASDKAWQLITIYEAWPMFRHDPTHAGYSTSFAPIKNDTLWSPLQVGPSVISEAWMYPSPAVVEDVIFMSSPNSTGSEVYALYTNGTIKWKTVPASGYRIYSSPASADGLVYVGCENGYVYALYATNGSIKWSSPVSLGNPIYSSPTISGNEIFVGSQEKYIYALDKDTGTKLKTSPWLGGVIESSPAIAYGMVFVGLFNGSVYALNETNLQVIWNYPTGGAIRSSPAVAYDTVFIGSQDDNLYALKATTNKPAGEKKWNYTTYGDVDSSPAIAYGMVFVGSTDGNVYAFNATTSTAQLIWNKTMGSIGWSSPAIAEEKVFIGSKDWKVYALSIAENGSEVWSYKTNGPVESSPAILNDTLYVGSQDGYLYAFHSEVHDVAVLSVIPKSTTVFQNETVNIDVTLMNEGTFNETDINVTVYYDSNFLNSSFINIPRQKPGTISFSWNTSDITPANYTISANATLTLTSDEDPLDNNFTDGIVWVKAREVHDVAVTNVTTSKTGCKPPPTVCQNYTAKINVLVENQGDFSETFNVTAYASTLLNTYTIGTQTVTLSTKQNTTLTFTWDTHGYAKGDYTIWARADQVSGEANTTDNTYTDGVITVTMQGDINADKIVNTVDIVRVALAFGAVPANPNWDPNANINGDEVINIVDIAIVALHFGETG